MKKMPLLTVQLLALALPLAACAQPAPAPEPEPPDPAPAQVELPQFTEPTFYLSHLPQLAPYEAPREILSRYSREEFVDTLQAASDYGKLYPYEGKVYGEEWWSSRVYYGLADAKGRVVVDSVYRYTYFTEPEQNGGQTYLVLAYPVADDDEKAQALLKSSDGWIQRCRYVVASPDGSWVSSFFYGDNLFVSGNRIIVTNYSEDPQNMWSSSDQTYRIYDMQGRLIASGEGSLDSFYDGRARLIYEAPDARPEEKLSYTCYLDTDGNVAIPGPFTEAYNFKNGRAVVAIGTDWDNRLFAVINTQGEYVVEPGPEMLSGWDYQQDYSVFDAPGADNSRGIKDSAGNIIAPAIYSWIDLPYEEDVTLAVATKVAASSMGRESHWLIDLLSGEARKIEIEYFTIHYANVYSNNWCVATYAGGTALLKGEQIYRFDAPVGSSVDCRQIKGELFAINYTQYDEQNHATFSLDVFDAKEGRVIKTLPNCYYSNMLNDELLIVNIPPGIEYMRALNLDFSPAFGSELVSSPIRSIGWVADDVYSVRTTLYSGLLRVNGEWLLRVNVNNLD